ncbi:hypothetical protein [Nocardioides sp.]|uniref:hypothetical protein n=1 Tax=Nocardioides sp. TaxID=35761 RepID=UPI0025D5FCE6|nr:hypothetical protein [Nocardioides sp.]
MATSTKIKPRTLANAIASAEERIQSEAEKVRSDLARFTDALPALRQTVEDIKDGIGAVSEVEAAWRKGEDLPDIEYAVALGKDRMAQVRKESYERQAKALRSRLVPDHVLLAEEVAPVFKALLPGVEVIATNAPLKDWSDDVPTGTVGVVLHQHPDVQVNPYTGVLSGKVTAYYLRAALHRPVNVETLERSAKTRKVILSVASNEVGDESAWSTIAGADTGNAIDPEALVIDALTMRVDGVVDALPVILKVDPSSSTMFHWVNRMFDRDPSTAVYRHTSGENGPGSWTLTAGPRGAFRVVSHEPTVTEEIDDAGTRTAVVTVAVNTVNVFRDDFASYFSEAATNDAGAVTVGLGSLKEARLEHVSTTEGYAAGAQNYRATFTYESRAA